MKRCVLTLASSSSSSTQCKTKNDAVKEMNTLGLGNFPIPGDPRFPLNAFYQKPKDKNETGDKRKESSLQSAGGARMTFLSFSFPDQLQQYFLQLRQELGLRLAHKVFEADKPSKVGYISLCAKKKTYTLSVVDVFLQEKVHGEESECSWPLNQNAFARSKWVEKNGQGTRAQSFIRVANWYESLPPCFVCVLLFDKSSLQMSNWGNTLELIRRPCMHVFAYSHL